MTAIKTINLTKNYGATFGGLFVSIVLWQLQKYPSTLIGTLSGYAVSYVIITIIMYKNMKQSTKQVNSLLDRSKQ